MDRTEDELAHDAHTAWALGQLAERLDALTERDWWEVLRRPAPLTLAVEDRFTESYRLQLRETFPELPPFSREWSRLVEAGADASALALRRKIGSPERTGVYDVLMKSKLSALKVRAAIAIMWRDRLTEAELHVLTKSARDAGISFDDLL